MTPLADVAQALASIDRTMRAGEAVVGVPELRHAVHLLHQDPSEITLVGAMADPPWHGATTAAVTLRVASSLGIKTGACVTAGLAACLHILGPQHPETELPLHQSIFGLVPEGGQICAALAAIHDPGHPLFLLVRGACLVVEASAPEPGLALPWPDALSRVAAALRPEVVQLFAHAFATGFPPPARDPVNAPRR
jgi:hypothetical protein